MIAGIVLAAGLSRRMGRPKLLLPLGDGKPLVRLAVERVLAARLDSVVVVLGAEADAVAAALADLPVRTIVNPRHVEGQSTSLRAGVDALGPGMEAAVVALGDQPLPDPTLIARLVETFRETGRPIVVPRYLDGRGNPVLFSAAVFDELRAVGGDQGGRSVIARDPGRVAEVLVDATMPADVDTPDDYTRLLGQRPGGSPSAGRPGA
jgi:molybdenum cofactor cytidylyltransferase